MASSLRPLFTTINSLLLLLLLYLGCFIATSHHQNRLRSKKHKIPVNSSPPPPRRKLKPTKPLSATWSFVKRVFSRKPTAPASIRSHPAPSIPSPSSSTRSLRQSSSSAVVLVNVIPLDITLSDPPRIRPINPGSEISTDVQSFPLRNDIYPCPACAETFRQPNLLEQHQAIKHAVSELVDGDSGNNIVRIIFKTGWPNKANNPTVHRILKIHNSPKALARFEEYRQCVKTKATRSGSCGQRRDERCIADGNEQLRFHCTTFLCELGRNGNSGLCNQQYCSVCGIINSGFSPKMDGISTSSTSWMAHVAIPDEIEEEFKFMNARRVMLVCRVIAGRVGCDPGIADKEDPGFDSLASRGTGIGRVRMDEEDELLVFNHRAVLPCFAIVYTV